jgi:uncharacterized damage-inducible protein DinB
MFTKNGLLQNYNWAVASFDTLFEHCRGFSGEELLQEHAGFGFPCLWDQLAHILICENYWLENITGKSAVDNWHEPRTLEHLLSQRPTLLAATREYISSATEEELNTERTFEGDPGELPVTCSPAFVIQHVITHGYHHKGQAVAMCRLLGRPAPGTDMLRWLPA